ncbi:MAG TPA: putative quinol monooxygenase [Solirubrobacteraceae bacterium]|nr:putative quinol monooxygenase [Solirubrobacteraceae bacterium]
MSEIVVVGSFTARPGQEAEAQAVFESLLVPTHAEPGCILYALHRGVDNPARLTFIERWASREDLEAHLGSDHIAAALARADELFIDGGDITVYAPLPGGDASKGTLA